MREFKNIMDINPKSVENTKGLCICDKCESTFDPKDTLMETCNNIEFQRVIGIKAITKGGDTYYLVSPCCKETHLFGFDIK